MYAPRKINTAASMTGPSFFTIEVVNEEYHADSEPGKTPKRLKNWPGGTSSVRPLSITGAHEA
jgi:hypothetical protein